MHTAIARLLVVVAVLPGLAALALARQGGLNFGPEIQASVRALRALQDPLLGSYGHGVEGTSWALRAFAECPDRYRAADGPWVEKGLSFLVGQAREDGAICDPAATGEQRVVQTRLATATLTILAEASSQAALTRGLKFLSQSGLSGPGWDAEQDPASLEAAQAAGQKLLSARGADKLWSGAQGKVIESARAILALSACERVVKRHQPKLELKPAVALPSFSPADRAAALAAIEKGARFLAGTAIDGRFGQPGSPDAGITALSLAALCATPQPRAREVQSTIDAGLAWLASLQKPDGSIHDGKLANYVTSASIMALTRSKKPEFAPAIARAREFLRTLQADEGEGYSEGDLYYGGIGYGSTERPDLSNLQMALQALHDAGLPAKDDTYAKALAFLQRCQNRSETNDVQIVDGALTIVSGDDGGAGYAPGDSKAGFVELGDGRKVPRSYGSMTYALLKCLVFAGLAKDDPRLAAAFEWCRKNYTLDVNPGFAASIDPTAAYQGLFYYFETLAQALSAYGVDELTDAAGKRHAWRNELCGRLVAMQSKIDGSWLNQNSPRWYEGNPLVATAYALLALDAALPR